MLANMFTQYAPENAIFADTIRKFSAKNILPYINDWEKKSFFPNELFLKLGAEGFLGILLPEKYGGLDSDYKLAATWCETIGEIPATGLAIAVNMHNMVIAPAISRLASEQIKDKWLSKSVSGEAIGAYAFTEPNTGSDLLSIKTTAKKNGDHWIINGAKTFITNGARAHFVLVLTRTDSQAGSSGFTTFVVDTSTPGFKVNRKLEKLGWHSSDTAELSFSDMAVPNECILGAEGQGWKIAMQSLNWERIMLSLSTLGAMRRCYLDTKEYAANRKAFGNTIDSINIISSYLDEMFHQIKISESLTYQALDDLITGRDARLNAALAKRFTADQGVKLADRAIQIHGGYGYSSEFLPERWFRDLRLMPIGGGTSEIMANIAAKEMGLNFSLI